MVIFSQDFAVIAPEVNVLLTQPLPKRTPSV
jgi:hypothetical protein